MSAKRPVNHVPNAERLARSLALLITERLGLPRAEPTVIAVAGESGSGKSTTATGLARELTTGGIGAGLVHQDNYFFRPPRTNHEYRLLDLSHVGPHEVNLELLQSHIDAFLAGSDGVEAPAVDYPANRFVTQQLRFSALAVLIVEGTYVFRLRGIGARVFLDATHEDTKERRRVRNRDIDAPVIDQILAIEHEIIARQANQADIVIDRDFVIRERTQRT
jgi:uridine kinase